MERSGAAKSGLWLPALALHRGRRPKPPERAVERSAERQRGLPEGDGVHAGVELVQGLKTTRPDRYTGRVQLNA